MSGFAPAMGKKSKSKRGGLGGLLRHPVVHEALADVIAAAIVALAAAIGKNARVRREAARLKREGEAKLAELGRR
ncbi:MAG TPA: hypothetical protein VE567_09370 [Sphingomonas sp.]|nr:hypothetical protein [Sphingomonas sp.]